MRAIEASLKRLGTDYIDLYQTHWPDHGPARDQEVLGALDDLVREGKVRITGCSNETSWGLMHSPGRLRARGLRPLRHHPEQLQPEQPPLRGRVGRRSAARTGVSLIPYSPLAGGVLSGKYQGSATAGRRAVLQLPQQLGGRQATMARRFVNDKSLASTERFAAIAAEAGVSVVTLAVAWSKQPDFVASTIVGATHVDQVDDILAAADVDLGRRGAEADRRGLEGHPLPDGVRRPRQSASIDRAFADRAAAAANAALLTRCCGDRTHA